MPEHSQRSVLFGLELRGRNTGAVESARSYLQRLAFAHHVKPGRLLNELAHFLPTARAGVGLGDKVNALHVSGMGPAVRMLRDGLEHATQQDLAQACMDRFAHVLSAQRMTRRAEGLHCQECVRQLGDDGLPHGQLLWELQVVSACPIHGVRLTSSDECAGQGKALPLNARPSLAGVCRACGSIGFRCTTAHPTPASSSELWVARQAAALVALSPAECALLTPASVRAGIGRVVKDCFGGQPVKAALASGLARATVLTWMKTPLLPSLDTLLRLCWTSNASLVDLLRGQHHAVSDTGTDGDARSECEVKERSYRRLNVDWLAVRQALLQEVEASESRSVEAVAAAFGVNRRQLLTKLPAETRALGQRTKARTQLRMQQRARELEARYEAAARALARDGLNVSTKSLQERSGLPVYASRNHLRAHALQAVFERSRTGMQDGP